MRASSKNSFIIGRPLSSPGATVKFELTSTDSKASFEFWASTLKVAMKQELKAWLKRSSGLNPPLAH